MGLQGDKRSSDRKPGRKKGGFNLEGVLERAKIGPKHPCRRVPTKGLKKARSRAGGLIAPEGNEFIQSKVTFAPVNTCERIGAKVSWKIYREKEGTSVALGVTRSPQGPSLFRGGER